jgi:gamma-glutamyltranspeptidase/glutathione hydrolase
VVATVGGRGGVLEADDFRFGRAEWVPAAVGSMEGWTVWATPAPTHGEALIACVESGASVDGPGRLWARLSSAMAWRDASLADPGRASTSMVSAADAEGNVVVVVHSNSFPRFGSGLVVGDLDLILNNRAGRGFSPEPGHPNFPAPGRRPATTLHAWAVGHDGRPALLGGTPGGVNQLPWNAQLLGDIAGGCTDPGLLITAPRWEWIPDRKARVEADYAEAGKEELRGCFDDVQEQARWTLRSAQQIVAVVSPGAPRVGAVDPRTGGAVVAD